MRTHYLPLPINKSDRICSIAAEGFIFTEALHAPLTTLVPHAHAHANLTVLLDGVFDESYAGRVESCARYSLLCRPVGERHGDRFGRTGAHNLSIEIENWRLDAIGNYTDALETVWQWRDERVITIARRMWRELRMRDAAATLALESLALELIALASRRTCGQKQRREAPPWLRSVREMLHARFKEQLRVGELSACADVHPVYLARAFRAYYKCTPGVYLRRLRIEWASRQLTATAGSLSEIAQEAGFYDQSHFTRAFKQATGLTPAQFRKRTHTGIDDSTESARGGIEQ